MKSFQIKLFSNSVGININHNEPLYVS